MHKSKSVKNDPSRHLLIAGTGRAGTSFLVKYLTELGLDTHLSRGKDASWDDTANAGLEDIPLTGKPEDLPYVAKTPWLYQLIDQLLEEPDFKIDGVIIPIRDLIEAASSRSVREFQNIHHNIPWMTKLKKPWNHTATVPGGIVYSTYPLDQARILAMGQHILIDRLVEHDIPFTFLAFPRLIEDPDYLYKQLRQFLPTAASKEKALNAHKKIADRKKVRVTKELAGKSTQLPSLSEIENIALNRELEKTRDEVRDLQKRFEAAGTALETEHTKLETERSKNATLSKTVQRLRNELKSIKQNANWRSSKPVRLASNTLRRVRR